MKEIFHEAGELDGRARARYLDKQCPEGDMRAEVERLLVISDLIPCQRPDLDRGHRWPGDLAAGYGGLAL